jgi:pre-mRNA-splicing factor ATP-dependent RNA helicase DHX38/PRP16
VEPDFDQDGDISGPRRDVDDLEDADPDDFARWREEQRQLDREWYDFEEGGMTTDETHNPFAGHEDYYEQKEQEFLVRQQTTKKISARALQYSQDNEKWERQLMLRSGVAQQGHVDLDFADEEEKKVHIMTNDLNPPFLDGRIQYSTQLEPIKYVKDPTSDMAVISRKGSPLVMEIRERKERQKATKEALKVDGTAFGNLMGVRERPEDTEDQDDGQKPAPLVLPQVKTVGKLEASSEEPEIGPRGSNQASFAQHLKSKSDAVSSFAKSKTLQEQREFLPIFSVRQDLLQVIRDNQIVIIVGETGRLS